MGLAPYGQPLYKDLIYQRLAEVKPDGSLSLNMEYFNYCQGLTMTSQRLHDLFGGPPRRPGSPAARPGRGSASSRSSGGFFEAPGSGG